VDWTALGHYLEESKRYPLLSAKEEKELALVIRAGGPEAEAAKERFVKANLRLVASIAASFSHLGVPTEDMIQDGNIGLIRALQTFNPDLGYRFSTYASWWIRQSITRSAYNTGAAIRLPVGQQVARNHVVAIEKRLHLRLNRPPTLQEVAEASGVTEARARAVLALPKAELLLDNEMPDSDDTHFGDSVTDPDALSVEDDVTQEELKSKCLELLSVLDPRSRSIFLLRFDDPPASLEEIGAQFGITRERVRQILIKEMPKVRAEAIRRGIPPPNKRL
jgi:RNA polymerase primary sigma factor